MKVIKYLGIIALAAILGVSAFIYSGTYPMGADVPHNKLTYWLLETLREQSIARVSKDIVVPPLGDPDLLLSGGADYNEMCATCHLRPGKVESDMSSGLYPIPPNLSQTSNGQGNHEQDDSEKIARRQFWIIKHGIKASGMPAWGPTHDDQRIWAMVSFLQKLPQLTPDQYQILTAREQSGENSHH